MNACLVGPHRYGSHDEPRLTSPSGGTLEKMVSWTSRERLRCLWYWLRLTMQEMNYAARRIVELQAAWISDDHPR
jgi:hypothetical protein